MNYRIRYQAWENGWTWNMYLNYEIESDTWSFKDGRANGTWFNGVAAQWLVEIMSQNGFYKVTISM